MRRTIGVMAQSLALGLAEFRNLYSLRSWTIGWLVRMLAQVAFFGSIGLLIRSRAYMQYLLVGNAVVIVALEATIVVLFMAGERFNGTLQLLLTTPTQAITVFLGRGLNWIATGVVTATITLILLPPLFGVPVPPLRLLACLPVLVVIGIAAYAYGSFLGGLTLRMPSLDWLVLNVGYLLVMTLAGVNVPVAYWPAAMRAVAQLLPVTHGLHAIRGILAGGQPGAILADVGLEVVVGAGWLLAAGLSYQWFIAHARRRGSTALG